MEDFLFKTLYDEEQNKYLYHKLLLALGPNPVNINDIDILKPTEKKETLLPWVPEPEAVEEDPEEEDLTVLNGKTEAEVAAEKAAKKAEKLSKLKSFASGFGQAASVAGDFVDGALLGDKSYNKQSEAIDTAVDAGWQMAMSSGNPWLIAAAGVAKGLNVLDKGFGKNITGADVSLDNKGYGTLGHLDQQSYRLTQSNLAKQALNRRNIKVQKMLDASDISEQQRFELEARMNSSTIVGQMNENLLSGELNTSILAAKQGTKLERLLNRKELFVALSKAAGKTVTDENGNKVRVPSNIDKDQKAGRKSFTYKGKEYYLNGDSKTCVSKESVDKGNIKKALDGAKLEQIEISDKPNVLPTGELHKNKHDLDLKNITKKGIPVITVNDDSATTFEEIKELEESVVIHAEIERSEIIFNKPTTDYIEDLRKAWHESDDKDDSILLEVGKRITKEILMNTTDNDNLIGKEDARM